MSHKKQSLSQKYRDLTGKTINDIEFLEYKTENKDGRALWRAKCYCGVEWVTDARRIISGDVKSCGCAMKKHGGYGTRLYRIWANMKSRCNNPNDTGYHHYGGRGITVCDEWNVFIVFQEWSLLNGYTDTLTIDRINNDRNYTPENCRWVNQETQMRNQRLRFNNTSGFAGVRWRADRKKWAASIRFKDKQIYNGHHTSFLSAVRARQELELECWGYTNITQEQIDSTLESKDMADSDIQ